MSYTIRQSYDFLLSALFVLGTATTAGAQWVLNGVPACRDPGIQIRPGVTYDGAGGAVVFWVDRRDLNRDLYAQRITSQGVIAPGWPTNGTHVGTGVGEVWSPHGVPDGTGGAIIVWEDNREITTSLHNIYAQRVRGDGTIAPGWPVDGFAVCDAPKDQRVPRIVSDGEGGAVIVWDDARNDPSGPTEIPKPDIYALRITGSGQVAPGWEPNGSPICTEPEAQVEPTLARDGIGGIFISWYDLRSSELTGADIYVQRVLLSGQVAPGWAPDGSPVCTVQGDNSRPQTVGSSPGKAIIIWKDRRSFSDPNVQFGSVDIYATQVQADGTISPGWPVNGVALCTAPATQQALSAGPDGLGGAVVAWEDYRSQFFNTGTASDIYVQRVTAEGEIPIGWPADGVAVCTASNFQIAPELVPDGVGGVYVAWEDPRSGQHQDVYAQHILATGEIAEGSMVDGFPVMAGLKGGNDVRAVSDGVGGAILAWEDFREGAPNRDIYAHKLGVDGPVPVRISFIGAEATTSSVTLEWYGKDLVPAEFSLQRKHEGGLWQPLGSPARSGPDRLRYIDLDVEPGRRYVYQLRSSQTPDPLGEEIWVEIPAEALHLTGFRPNPARGVPQIHFTLPTAQPALLEVVDVRGRMVYREDVGALGPGEHTVDLTAQSQLLPGVYWIRLTQGERESMARGVVLR